MTVKSHRSTENAENMVQPIDNDYNIRLMKALYGDALILNCYKGSEEGIVVVDGGPNKDCRKIVAEFDKLGTIGLMVLTHYDLDHIGGILAYISKHKDDKPFPVKEIWCNCAYEVPIADSKDISYGHAKKLADLLTTINENLRENGFPEVSWQKSLVAGQTYHRPFADFFILSPEEGVKAENDKQYQKEIANISNSHKRQKDALLKSLEELSVNPKDDPSTSNRSELVNWSSIAFYVSCDNMKALMLGDSYPETVVKSLHTFGFSEEDKLNVDYFKVSHHGSRNNISNDLLDRIDCDQYLFSTNGGLGTACHPDRETIGNILYHKNRDWSREIKLYFNYCQSTIEGNGYKFLNEGEEESGKFKSVYNTERI